MDARAVRERAGLTQEEFEGERANIPDAEKNELRALLGTLGDAYRAGVRASVRGKRRR